MNVRRSTVMFRHAVPRRWPVSLRWGWPVSRRWPAWSGALMPYAAALATIVVLAVLLSFGARRVMQPFAAANADSGFGVSSASGQRADGSGRAQAGRSQAAGRRENAPANARTAAGGAAAGGEVALPPAIEELRRRHLSLPVNGVRADQLVATFDEARGDRPHEAIDIMAPRGTPVVAPEGGRIAKLFWSKAGGHTIYQFDPSERYVYYYAHLDRYADGLAEGQTVTRGQTIGFVGSTGNAKADASHLHFAIFLLTPEKRWWDGMALDPYPVLRWNIDGGTP
jgi:peptidoglycan LD-endopeptidase LytH